MLTLVYMSPMEEGTMVRVFKSTRDRLKERGKKGDSYDAIINRLIDEVEKHERPKR